MSQAYAIAIVGAESTGKTHLTLQLKKYLSLAGFDVTLQTEWLRTWCEKNQKIPDAQDQKQILELQVQSQNRWRESVLTTKAKTFHSIFISDTAALQTAAYSRYYFADFALDSLALEAHQIFDLTFLMGLDLTWQEDPLRTGSHSQKPVDHALRELLQSTPANLHFATVYGHGLERLQNVWWALKKQKFFSSRLLPLAELIELEAKTSNNALQFQARKSTAAVSYTVASSKVEQSIVNQEVNYLASPPQLRLRHQEQLEKGKRAWTHFCENCADGECESKLFQQLKNPSE